MCKRNSPNKNETSTGCVTETPRIKMKPAWDVSEKLEEKIHKTSTGCVRETPDIRNEASTVSVRETSQVKIKVARDVYEKLP